MSGIVNIFDDLPISGNIALDTSPIIYLIEDRPRYVGLMYRIVGQRISTGINPAVTSVISLAEALVKPLKEGHAKRANQFRRLLKHTLHVKLMDISPAIAERAA